MTLKPLDSLAQRRAAESGERRIALIDMGSNSFRLIVIAYVSGLSFKMVDEIREVVRLSEGMAEAGVIRAAAIERALRAAHIYASFCRAAGISDIVAVGTSALRDGSNAASLLARIKAETGLHVRVISGEEEAAYGYLAAVNSTTLTDGFVFDLGGGSVQITRVQQRQMRERISLPLGVVRMSERFLPNDPPRKGDLERLQGHLQAQFGALQWYKMGGGERLVGVGGMLRQMARLAQKQSDYVMDDPHGYVLTRAQMDELCKRLAALDVAGRKKMAGMKADRADIALGGAFIIREVMRAGGFETLEVCSQSVREGLFYERFLGAEASAPLFDDVRRAAIMNLAHLYRFQEKHAQHVARLTLAMFDQLRARFGFGESERELLWAASMLHDIGVIVDYNEHHKHGAYLILNAGLPGFTHREIALIALMTRYHRKGEPGWDELRGLMQPGDEIRLAQWSALLRLAEHLDRARDGVVQQVHITLGANWAQMELYMRGDEKIALWSAEQHRGLFEAAFGLELQLVAVPYESA
ncbi:MAG: Ppx/GppA family phosphatase [Chloroflexi bacterium]|nr:Ppx/GppA family phosphatase [Chloroflexota bacterium]